MDKRTFISQLRQALSVLQKDELEDIVTEYQQHIDMKMKNGLSEEEAIADFGSFQELTAEILGAYHVRADYAQDQKKERKRLFLEDGTAGKELLSQTGKTCRNVGEKAVGSVRGLGTWLLGILRFWKQKAGEGFAWIGGWWRNRSKLADPDLEAYWDETGYSGTPEDMAGRVLEMKAEAAGPEAPDRPEGGKAPGEVQGQGHQGKDSQGPEDRIPGRHGEGRDRGASRRRKRIRSGEGLPGGIRVLFRKLADLASACLHLGLALVAWGIRMVWNVCWIGFACFCACFGLFSLFTLGMLTVLWMQHYPLAGVTVGCLGLVLCSFSAAWFSLTLLWRKRVRASNEEMEGEQHV